MASANQKGDKAVKKVKGFLESLGHKVWIPIRSRFNPNEIFGLGDGLSWDGANYIPFQVKVLSTRGRNWDLKLYAREIAKELKVKNGDLAPFWFFFVEGDVIEWYNYEEGLSWSLLGEYLFTLQ